MMWWYFFLFVVARGDFAVIGDWGRAGTEDQKEIATVLNEMDLDFVISTGDNFYPSGLTSVTDPQVHDLVRIYNSKVPWYLCLGNHDYRGDTEAQIRLTDVFSKWNMPSRYFQKKIGDIEFWFLDTTAWLDSNHNYKDEPDYWLLEKERLSILDQYQWLEHGLMNSTALRKIIVGHHPLWTFGEHVHEDNDKMLQDIPELMERYNVESYLCGHDHNLQYVTSAGVQEFISGGGAWYYEWTWQLGFREMDDAELHFGTSELGVLVVSEDLEYTFYSKDGKVMYFTKL